MERRGFFFLGIALGMACRVGAGRGEGERAMGWMRASKTIVANAVDDEGEHDGGDHCVGWREADRHGAHAALCRICMGEASNGVGVG